MSRRNNLLPRLVLAGAVLAPAVMSSPAVAQAKVVLPVDPPANVDNPRVGGAAMDRDATILDNLARSGDHARLVQAVDAAGLASALRGMGPLTVFAPTDGAFLSFDDGDELLKEENRGKLADLLRYHVVAGMYDRATLDSRIDGDGDGVVHLTTVLGKRISVRRSVRVYTVTDATNNTATITVGDVYQRNGVVHVVDAVLMPEVR